MNYNFIFKKILIFCISAINIQKSVENKWLSQFFHEITDLSLHQSVIMLDGKQNSNDLVLKGIIEQLSNQIPVRIINYFKKKPETFRSLVASRTYHKTTLFLTILNEIANPKRSLDFLVRVSGSISHPRCLIIFQNSTSNQKKFFKFGWSKNFLDLTAISLITEHDFNGSFIRNYRWDNEMHQYNPFTRTYIQNKFSTGKKIFPDKLKDLNGFEMTTGKSSGYDEEGIQYKPHTNYIPFLSEIKNLKTTGVVNDAIGKAACNGNQTTRLIAKLVRNKVRFLNGSGSLSSKCMEYPYTFAIDIKKMQVLVLVPII